MTPAAIVRTADTPTPTPAEPAVSLTVPLHPAAKIAHKTKSAKNRLQDEPKNRPDIINPVSLCGVIDEGELKALLGVKKQTAWCSRVRVHGLLLLIDHILRHLKGNGTISISADLAHQFVSKLREKDYATTITEPLLLLCKVGILEMVRPAVCAHIKTSAVYRFAAPYRRDPLKFKIFLTPKLAQKRAFAFVRCEARLNRKFLWREKLLADLRTITFSNSARPIIAQGFSTKGSENLTRLVSAVDAQQHFVKVSVRGQITTSISNCPRELQPHLLLNGELTASCDVSHAHWDFLPFILANRLRLSSGLPDREKYVADGWREHDKLTLILSDGDFYRAWCVNPLDDAEREQKKDVLNILLHRNNEDARANCLYRRVASEFPVTFRVIEDIKRKDHRNLSKQLHRFLADAMAAALLELQQKGIAAIPHVDALICEHKDRDIVCEALGKQIFLATGVCPKVGGVRYSPLTEEEQQALAFDEIEPSDDGMSYDEWEAMRFLKCTAALKLMRRCPPLFSPFALAAYRSI